MAANCVTASTISNGYKYEAFKDTSTSTSPCVWNVPSGVTKIEYLLVGGGGGGGHIAGGGGGGGGVLNDSSTVSAGNALTISVGNGGTGGTSLSSRSGSEGGSTSLQIGSITHTANGGKGGSSPAGTGGNSGTFTGGSGVRFDFNGNWHYAGGGGAGAHQAGNSPTAYTGNLATVVKPIGGVGKAFTSFIDTKAANALLVGEISNNEVYFSGGGGGGSTFQSPYGFPAGGLGGGGTGQAENYRNFDTRSNGKPGTGGGGGGAGFDGTRLSGSPSDISLSDATSAGGSGGSGVIVIKYRDVISPTITFSANALSPGFIGETTSVTVTTNSTGSLTVNTDSSNSVCSLSDTVSGTKSETSTVNFLATGDCLLEVSVTASGNYLAKTETKTITVYPRSTISFNSPPTTAVVSETSVVNFTTNPATGITVVLSSSTPDICTTSNFEVTYVGTGTCTLKANAAKTSSYSAALEISTSINVSRYGAVSKISIAQAAGASLANNLLAPQPIIYLLDSFNNIVEVHDTRTVTASIPSATLSGTTTVPFINGIATFTDLKINLPSTYPLSFTSNGLTTAQTLVIAASFPICTPTQTFISGDTETVLTFKNTTLCDWTVPAGIDQVEVLVIGGGGGSGSGGGGSGGFIQESATVTSGQVIKVVAGAGGEASTGLYTRGGNGQSSLFGTKEAGGGAGGGRGTISPSSNGGDAKSTPTYLTSPTEFARGNGGGGSSSTGANRLGGTGTFNGASTSGVNRGGGGGGAGGNGGLGVPGLGKTSSITGSSVTYARGGYGAEPLSTYLTTPNTGNGGASQSGEGQDGVVIVRYRMAPSKIGVVSATGTQIAGTAFTPKIQLQNDAGLLLNTDTATVTVSISGTSFTSGTTSVSTISGQAEFANLVITEAGIYTLTYIPTGASYVTRSTTETITVTAAAPSSVEIVSGNQQAAKIGTAIASAPKIKVTDQYGNPISGASVTFSVGTNSGSLSSPTTKTTAADGTAIAPTWTLGSTKGEKTLIVSVVGWDSTLNITAIATGTPQSITFGSLSTKTVGDSAFTVTASATSSLAVRFSTTTASVCDVNETGTVTIKMAGLCSITAVQLGDGTWAAALPVTQVFTVASPAPASIDTCNVNVHNGIVVTPSHGKTFYVDLKMNPKIDASYIGYIIKNTTNSQMKDIWVTLMDFTGGALALANSKDAYQQIESIPAGGSFTVYFLLKASQESEIAQQHTVVVTQGHPDSNGVSTFYSCYYSFDKVFGTIKAAANKVTSVNYSTLNPVIGGTMTITIKGEPGVIGSGTASSDGSIIWLTPSAYSTWPTRSLRLEAVRLDIGVVAGASGCSTTYLNQLLINQAEGCHKQMPYTATFTFRVIAAATGPITVAPVAQIASGTQIKHTDMGGSASAVLNIVPQQTVTVDKKAVTGAKRVLIGGASYAEVPYELVATSTSNIESQLDQIVDKPAPGALFVPDSGKISYGCGTSITSVNPTTKSTDLGKWFFIGPFPVTFNCPVTIEYKAYLPLTAGASTYSNVALADTGEQSLGDTPSSEPQSEVTLPPDPGPDAGESLTVTVDNDLTEPMLPTATTHAPSNVGTTSATFNGVVFNGGTAAIAFEYRVKGTNGAGTLVTNPTVSGSFPVGATKTITIGLVKETTYEYRIKSGTAVFGEYIEFTTGSDAPTPTISITTPSLINGTVGLPYLDNIDSATTGAYPNGVEWSILHGELPPGLTFDTQTAVIADTPTVAGTYTFTVTLAEGKPIDAPVDWEPTLVVVKTYTIIIGSVESPKTMAVTTLDATLVSKNSARLNGEVDYITSGNWVTFVYWKVGTPSDTTTVNVAPSNGLGDQPFAWTLTGLTSNTTYAYRIVSPSDSLNGQVKNFTTTGEVLAPPTPTVTTRAATNVARNSAIINGLHNNVNRGDALVFRYSKSPDLLGALTIVVGSSNGSSEELASNLDRLDSGALYYFQILTGELVGEILSFRTTSDAPASNNQSSGPVRPVETVFVVTLPAINVTTTTAVINGTITGLSSGDAIFEYGTLPYLTRPVRINAGQLSSDAKTPFDVTLTGLAPGKIYYFRITSGSRKGEILSFVTEESPSQGGGNSGNNNSDNNSGNNAGNGSGGNNGGGSGSTAGTPQPANFFDLPSGGVFIPAKVLPPTIKDIVIEGDRIRPVPKENFSGKTEIPLEIIINGETKTVIMPIVVNPLPIKEAAFTPTKAKLTTVRWSPVVNAVSYELFLDGKSTCVVTVTSCDVPQILGPKAKMNVVALGNDQTKSVQTLAAYAPEKPVPVLQVNFDLDKYNINAKAKKKLDDFVKLMRKQGFTTVVLDGHTDSQGSRNYNRKLAKNRVSEVAKYLRDFLTVEINRTSFGETLPIDSNQTLTGKANNRRVSGAVR